MYVYYTIVLAFIFNLLVIFLWFLKDVNTSIYQGCIKLIKSYSIFFFYCNISTKLFFSNFYEKKLPWFKKNILSSTNIVSLEIDNTFFLSGIEQYSIHN